MNCQNTQIAVNEKNAFLKGRGLSAYNRKNRKAMLLKLRINTGAGADYYFNRRNHLTNQDSGSHRTLQLLGTLSPM